MEVNARRLVGRAAELARVTRRLTRLREGEPGRLLLLGEPGIGKTRLLEAIAGAAAAADLPFRRAVCVPLATPLPLDAVTALLRRPGDHGRRAHLHAGARHELFTDALAAFEEQAGDGPIVLALDDLQWADRETISFLRYVLRRHADLPVLWVLASRPADSAEVLADEMRGLPDVDVLRLTGLSVDELAELARTLVGDEVIDRPLVETVHRRTDGNPLLAGELLRTATDPSSGAEARPVPAGVREAIAVRRRGLTPAADEVLRWCAVLPMPADVDWVLQLVGDDGVRCIPLLVREAFLVTDSDGSVTFVHDIVRDAVHRDLLTPDRRAMHARVADLLATAAPALRAPQLVAAGRTGEAAVVTCEVADDALLRGGADDARALYLEAERLAREAADTEVATRAAGGRVLALLRLGEQHEAHELARRVRRRLTEQASTTQLARFLSRYAMACWDDVADLQRAQAAVEWLVPLIDDLDGADAAEAILAQAHILNRAGRTADALPRIEQAASLAARLPGDADGVALLRTRSLVHLGLIRGQADSAAAGMTTLEHAIDLAQDHGFPVEEAYAWLARSFLAQHTGDEESHELLARRGLEVPSVPPALQAMLLANAAQGPVHRGQLAEAVEELERALAIAARAGVATEQRIAVTLVHALVRRGELDRAEALLDRIDVPVGSWEGTRVEYARALVAEERQAHEEAQALYASGATDLDNPSTVWSLAGVVRTRCRVGDVDGASAALDQLAALSGRWPVSDRLLTASRGHLAVAAGEVERGASLLDAAAAGHSDVFLGSRLRLDAALARRDEAVVRAVVTSLDDMGATLAAEQARVAASAVGLRPPDPGDQRWRVELLGPLRVLRGDRVVALPPGRPRTLVGLLAVTGPLRVARAIDLLWPDTRESDGRVRLRQVLYRLRQVAPDLVVRVADGRIALAAEVESDLVVFEALAVAARRPDADALLAAEQAVDLVRGPVLEDVEPELAPEQLEVARERIRVRTLALLDQLADAAEGRGDQAEAIGRTRHAVELDGFDERRVERLVRLLRSAGRGVEADDEIADLGARLRAAGLAPARRATPPTRRGVP